MTCEWETYVEIAQVNTQTGFIEFKTYLYLGGDYSNKIIKMKNKHLYAVATNIGLFVLSVNLQKWVGRINI